MVEARRVVDIKRPTGASIRISKERDHDWASRAVWVARSGPHAEAFRYLALRLGTELESRGTSSILVTSALPQEGKTLTACNLALAFASLATTERVALVDLDLRVPRVGSAFGLRPRVGIVEVLARDASLQSAAVVTDAALDIYPVATRRPAAHELLSRPELADAIKQLEARYRWVVCDTGPALLVPDVQIIAPHVGACMAVVRAGRTPRSALEELSKRLPRERMLGFFLNDARPPRHTRRYYRSAYYTADTTSEEEDAK
jgi:Mrp family chromosome partitioning ATPase